MKFDSVTAQAIANVYFDGKVVSHSISFSDGSKKTLGLIYPGSYHFGTTQAERMEITSGSCSVVLDGQLEELSFAEGSFFEVPAQSGFTIKVEADICQYVCSFLD